MTITRRAFLSFGAASFAALNLPVWARNALAQNFAPVKNLSLSPPDQNGLMLPKGFTSKIIARSGKSLPGKNFPMHAAPDGGAVFPYHEEGVLYPDRWIYVSNAELENKMGGVNALLFDKGTLIDIYPVLSNTTRNCAGGVYKSYWLSCEEYDDGLVWQCDPYQKEQARPLPALGTFRHEAAALDDKNNIIYLTEDQPDGLFYRFRFNNPDLTTNDGILEAAIVGTFGDVTWQPVPKPNGGKAYPTRYQLKEAMKFNGSEGCAYHDGTVYFSTKGDNRIWAYDTKMNHINILYDALSTMTPVLSGVDNIAITPSDQLAIAEDGGNNEMIILDKLGRAVPILRLIGHDKSELAGPAFSPDGTRLYFSSQRGTSGNSEAGVTFEVSGNFKSI